MESAIRSIPPLPGRLLLTLAISLGIATAAVAEERFITVASTTSTENSGLYTDLLPRFTEKTGIEIRVVAVGTGQAIRLAERGDADVLIAHNRPAEDRFVAQGHGVERHDLMDNDFVIVGPKDDPARVRGVADAKAALVAIAEARAPFTSRGDDSGTHAKERALWKAADLDPSAHSGQWYRETGSGMGATLNTASSLGAYALTDHATWLRFANKGDLEVLFEGDPALFNPYGIIRVSEKRHPHVKSGDADIFVRWMLSKEGQAAIGAYRIEGRQAFFPNAAEAK